MGDRPSAMCNRFSAIYYADRVVCLSFQMRRLTILRMCSCTKDAKIFVILFENNLVLRINQQSLVK